MPRSYLTAWTDPDTPAGQTPYCWTFNKSEGIASLKARAPKNLFTENDLYTVKVEGQRDLRLEHGFQGLEGEFVRIRDQYITPRRELPPIVLLKLAVFTAACFTRTPAARERYLRMWEPSLKLADEMAERMASATPEQHAMAVGAFGPSFTSRGRKGITHDELRRIQSAPMQEMMPAALEATASAFLRLPLFFSILCTDEDPGFITSDDPCTWHDPEGYKRPPMFRGPALMYRTTEVTLPLTPQRLLLISHHSLPRSRDISRAVVDNQNAKVRFYCDSTLVVRRPQVRQNWMSNGEPQPDHPDYEAWLVTQQAEQAAEAVSGE